MDIEHLSVQNKHSQQTWTNKSEQANLSKRIWETGAVARVQLAVPGFAGRSRGANKLSVRNNWANKPEQTNLSKSAETQQTRDKQTACFITSSSHARYLKPNTPTEQTSLSLTRSIPPFPSRSLCLTLFRSVINLIWHKSSGNERAQSENIYKAPCESMKQAIKETSNP
jgi:hypothetical protein